MAQLQGVDSHLLVSGLYFEEMQFGISNEIRDFGEALQLYAVNGDAFVAFDRSGWSVSLGQLPEPRIQLNLGVEDTLENLPTFVSRASTRS